MDDDARLFEIFLDVQRGLPRQGPGCADASLEALALCGGLPETPTLIDVGCGPGLQTMTLAEALDGRLLRPIAAVDFLQEYLAQLSASCRQRRLGHAIAALRADMRALPFAEESVDLVWAEGSAYVMGFGAALEAWRPLLRPGGYVALTELTWLEPEPPAEAAGFFAEEYPAMADVAANLATLRSAGYELLGRFTLPDAAWWDDYYTPLAAKLPGLRARYAEDPAALAVIAATAREIEMRRRYPESYGYVFYVGRKDG